MRQIRSDRAPRWRPWRSTALWTTAASVFLLIFGWATTPGRAGMLDAESCRRHKSEYDTLGASGIREMMAKGPDWAKTNLTKERIEQVRRYLALEEDVRFRCPLGKARPELEAAESEAGATTPLNADEAAPVAKAPPAAQAKPARKSKPSAAKTTAEQTTPEQGSVATLAPASAADKSGPQPEAPAAAPQRAAATKQKSTSAPKPQPPIAEVAEPTIDPVRKSPR